MLSLALEQSHIKRLQILKLKHFYHIASGTAIEEPKPRLSKESKSCP